MLTGKHPFGASEGLSASSVTDRILHETPLEIPQAALAGLPRHIPPVLDVALSKRPQDRFPDSTSFLEALKGPTAVADVVVPGKPSLPDAVPPRISRSRRNWLIGSVLGGLVVAAVAVLWAASLGEESELSSSATATSVGTTSTGQSVPAIVPATTTTSIAPTTTIATTTTTTATTTTTIVTSTRYEQTESSLVYTGAWSTTPDGSASGGSFLFANSSGASVSVTFEGTYLAWIAKKAPVYGKAEVTLDGKILGTIDLYSESIGWQQKVWGTGTLKSGLHTVTIAWTGTKNTAATDTNISVDSFDVVGTLTQVP
jgi:gas vesicle protein